MKITKQEIEFEDIMWLALDKHGKILVCTSGVYGNIPEFICESRENVNILIDFFVNKLKESTEAVILRSNNFGKELLEECKKLSNKGLFCFDAYDGINHTSTYTKISIPKKALNISDLPTDIQKIIEKNQLDINVENLDILEVTNPY